MYFLSLFGLPGMVLMIFVCYVYEERPSFRFGGAFRRIVERHRNALKESEKERE